MTLKEQFVAKVKSEWFLYTSELIDTLKDYKLDEYVNAVQEANVNRWSAYKILELIELEDTHKAHVEAGLSVVDASAKQIPEFLLKVPKC